MTITARGVIDLDVATETISPNLYGHFAEHLGRCIYGGFWVGEDSPIPNVRGIRLDVVEALRALDIPVLRWPGGCFADEYHWRDGIGPRTERPRMVNTHWGDVEENNHFGTHEFMDLCELLDADAYINGNVGSGTVQEMSEWVEYLTRDGDSPMARLRAENGHPEPWRVPFWGIGNEAWGCGGNMSAEHYANEARRYATFCRDHGSNRLTRIAAGAADDDLNWTKALMEALACLGCQREATNVFQAVSFHYYTHSGTGIASRSATEFDSTDYLHTIAKALDIDRVIRGHVAVMDAYDPAGKIGLVCDEWGTWWHVEPGANPGFLFQQNTVRDAIVAGLHFDIFHRHARRLTMANLAQTVNVLQAMLLTDDSGNLVRTPTYHVFEMNKGHQGAQRLQTHTLESPQLTSDEATFDTLSFSASVKDDTALVSLTHVGLDEPLEVRLDLRGACATVARARVLTGESANAHNTIAHPETIAPRPLDVAVDEGILIATLPPHSFATVTLALS